MSNFPAETLCMFLSSKTGLSVDELKAGAPLVSSGFLDSLGVLEVFLYIERLAGRKISESGVTVESFETLDEIFRTVVNAPPPAEHVD